MSNVFAIAAIPQWLESAQNGLLLATASLWIIWLGHRSWPLRKTPPMARRPMLPAVAVAAVSFALFSTLAAMLLKGRLGSEDLELAAAGSAGTLLACLLILRLLRWQDPGQFHSLGLKPSGLGKQLLWGLLIALAVWPMAIAFIVPYSLEVVKFFCQWVWGWSYLPQEHNLLREMAVASGPTLWLATIMAVLVAPIAEEILFRGLLQGALVGLFRSRWVGILLAAFTFALMHLSGRDGYVPGQVPLVNLENIPAIFFLGLALGYYYEKSRSLYRPIAAHLIFNALSVAFTFLQR